MRSTAPSGRAAAGDGGSVVSPMPALAVDLGRAHDRARAARPRRPRRPARRRAPYRWSSRSAFVGAVADVGVAADGRDGEQVELGSGDREPDRERVVEARVAVDDQRQRLLDGPERRRPRRRPAPGSRSARATSRPARVARAPSRSRRSALLVRLAGRRRPANAPDDARDDDDRDDVRDAVRGAAAATSTPRIASSVWVVPANPNTSAAPNAPIGCHAPKIIAARAMKPLPAVISIWKLPADRRATGTSPASPQMRPARNSAR